MTRARARSIVLPSLHSPTSAWATPAPLGAMAPATAAPGTCWIMSTPINLYALAFRAAQMAVEADRQAWHRRFGASCN